MKDIDQFPGGIIASMADPTAKLCISYRVRDPDLYDTFPVNLEFRLPQD